MSRVLPAVNLFTCLVVYTLCINLPLLQTMWYYICVIIKCYHARVIRFGQTSKVWGHCTLCATSFFF